MARHFEFSEGSSNKFWEISLDGSSFTVQFGRIGTSGQTQTKSFDSPEKAQREHDKLVAEKLKKGYVESGDGGGAASAPAPAKRRPPAKPAPAPSAPAPKKAPSALLTTASAPAGEGRIAWTDAARRKIHRLRVAGSGKPRRVKSPAVPQAVLDLWEAHRAFWQAGESKTTKEVVKLCRAFAERLAKPQATPTLDLDVEAAGYAMIYFNVYDSRQVPEATTPLVNHWLDVAGPAFAFKALARVWGYGMKHDKALQTMHFGGGVTKDDAPKQGALWLETRDITKPSISMSRQTGTPATSLFDGFLGEWPLVHDALLDAEDTVYAEAHAAAEALWKETPWYIRPVYAYALSDPDWAAESAKEVVQQDHHPRFSFLLGVLRDPQELDAFARAVGAHAFGWRYDAPKPYRESTGDFAFDFVERMGFEALPLLRDLIDVLARDNSGRKAVAEALAMFETGDAAAILARLLDSKQGEMRKLSYAYFTRCPALAASTLGPIVEANPKHDIARALLEQAARATGGAAPASAKVAAATAPSASSNTGTPDAKPADLPSVLASPPWLDRTAPKAEKPEVVAGLEIAAYEERCVWQPGEKKRHPYKWYLQTGQRYNNESDATDARRLKDYEAAIKNGEKDKISLKYGLNNIQTQMERVLAVFNTCPLETWEQLAFHNAWGGDSLDSYIAKFDERCLPGLLRLHERLPEHVLEFAVRIDAARLAPLYAQAFVNRKKMLSIARRWFTSFPEAAATGLVPSAVGPLGKPRDEATAALRWLQGKGQAETIKKTAARYGAPAKKAIEQLLAFDPLRLFPSKLPARPAWADPATLPRPLLAGRKKALPLEAVEHLLTMLAISTPDRPYAGLALVREVLDPASAFEFAWALFEAWQTAGASPKEVWAFNALAPLGGDEAARRLTPLLRRWPSEGLSTRAALGLDVLETIGTDRALMHLHGIAQKVRAKALQEKAREKMDAIAGARGLTALELADRLVPDLELDDDGSRVLDFGPRQFRVGFDEQLKPFVLDGDKKRLDDLPKPGKADDVAKANDAATVWKALKKDSKTVAAQQVLRLELALETRRRWDADVFRTFLVEHPLVGHLARRLVWASYDAKGKLVATFRVAEDRTLADEKDKAKKLAEGASVGIPHPLELDAKLVTQWRELFESYELHQPFPQLARETFKIEKAEAKATELERVAGKVVPFGKVLGLLNRGWEKEDLGESATASLTKKLGGDLAARLEFDPGLASENVAESGDQHLGTAQVSNLEGAKTALGALDPIVFSELVRDLVGLEG
jgi:predicted DNA-binding WGR domain protein